MGRVLRGEKGRPQEAAMPWEGVEEGTGRRDHSSPWQVSGGALQRLLTAQQHPSCIRELFKKRKTFTLF